MEFMVSVSSKFSEYHNAGLRKFILNINDETLRFNTKWLKMGDELCRGRMIPMSTDLTRKVRDIYKLCKSSEGDDTVPLILALDMGLVDMVWGFIECAKQTNTNLHTGEMGGEYVQQFFWQISNKQGQTTFDIAIDKNHMEVARLLLKDAHPDCLRSQWNLRGKALLDLLNDPEYDSFIFDRLENEKRSESRSTWTSVRIHSQRELKIRIKGVEKTVRSEFLDNLGNGLLGQDTSNNSVLHLVSKIGNVACIQYILEKDSAKMHSRNSDTETPVYVAAREGRVDVLRFMIDLLKRGPGDIEPIVTRTIDQHNALHIAIQNHHVEVIFLLIEKIPKLANCINEVKESPLYVAAERGYFGVVELMLNKCNEIAVEGPNGKTALHAAAISDSAECLEYLLNKYRDTDLLNVQDERGWTPFQYAVYHNSLLAATKLVDWDNTIGYKFFLEDGIYTSAIHIAASRDHCEIMELLMDKCPGCSEFIDNKGRNILHVAVENKENKAIEFIFRDESLTNLINQKDKTGNTPVHLMVASDFEHMEMLMDSRVNTNVLNNEKLTPLDMVSSRNVNFPEKLTPLNDHKERLIKAITMRTCKHGINSALSPEINKRGINELEREAKGKETETRFVIVDSLVVVAALITTASFAAALTVPGGYDSNNSSKQAGTPFLLKKPAFQAFVVTNAIAFSFSCSVLLGHIAIVFYRNRLDKASLDELEYIDGKIEDMYYLSTLALIALTIAFVTGLYVVLTPSLFLATFVCVMSLLFVAIQMHKDRFGRSQKAADIHVF